MHFSVNYYHRQGLDIWELADAESGCRVQLLPRYGCLWHAWYIPRPGAERLNLIEQYADRQSLEAELGQSFRGARLSPFACRIPEGKYTADGHSYAFSATGKDGSALHGLLYDKPFRVQHTRVSAAGAEVALAYPYRHEDPGYPFDYDCTVIYRLEPGCRLSLSTVVHNRSEVPIPLMDGWHPYFRTGTPVDRMMLQFRADHLLEFDARLVPTGRLLPNKRFGAPETLSGVELDNSFITTPAEGPVAQLYDPEKRIRILFSPGDTYPVLQIYIPPERRSIAIEHLSGPPDAFNNHLYLQRPEPDETVTFTAVYTALQE
ncbi:aldose 1-epimerase [Compostibacter hankyongensis]